jgi:hypothetical protein
MDISQKPAHGNVEVYRSLFIHWILCRKVLVTPRNFQMSLPTSHPLVDRHPEPIRTSSLHTGIFLSLLLTSNYIDIDYRNCFKKLITNFDVYFSRSILRKAWES